MPASSKSWIIGGLCALVVAGSWVASYRTGATAGLNLAAEVTGMPVGGGAQSAVTDPSPLPAGTPRPRQSVPPPFPPTPDAGLLGPDPAPAVPGEPSPTAVDQFLARVTDPQSRGLLDLRLRQAAQDLGLADIPGAIDGLAALPPGPKREAALLAVVGRWAQLSPIEAIDYAQEESIPALRTRMVDATFSGWALSDPHAAMAYLEQHPDWVHRETAERALFDSVAERPAAEAFQFLEGIDGQEQDELIHRTVSRLLDLSPLAVRDWAQGLPESPLREAVLSRSVASWAMYSPVEAEAWIMDHYQGEQLTSQLPRLAGAWARNDPEAARDWYLELPAELQSARVGEEVFESWLEEDRESARAYLDDARPRPELDQGFKEYAYQIQRQDPSQAMDLTSRIVDDETRSSTQSRVARYWAQRNPRATLAYLETSSIPVEDQAPLIRYAESRLKRQSQRNNR